MLHLWSTRPRREACLTSRREKSVKRVNNFFFWYNIQIGQHRVNSTPIKKTLLVLIALIGGGVVLLCLPLTSVAVLTVTVLDQNNQKMTTNVTATFLDRHGKPIIKITSKTPGSWDNNLHWWSHSSHSTSKLRPADAMRATSVLIEAKDCDAATLPIKLKRTYEPMSIAPHGGGAAYFIYKFDQSAVVQCH